MKYPWQRWAALALAGLLILVIVGLLAGSLPVSGENEQVRVTIGKNFTAKKTAIALKQARAIRSAAVFRLICKTTGKSSQLKPGVYLVSKSMGVREIIDLISSGKTINDFVTFPEGYTIRQIADVLEAKKVADGDKFVQMALHGAQQFANADFLLGRGGLEGYLFPDTYLLEQDTDLHAVIAQMLQAFERKVVKKYRSDIIRAGRERFGHSEEEFKQSLFKILILASMVEREARVPKDRPLIAAVLYNRLSNKMRLEICATVSYIPGESRSNKEKIYNVDTKADTPYNTYRIYGLPPTPICNPGTAAIEAVLNPAQVPYLYYVAKSDGSHIFSRTYNEHLAAKRKVSAR